MVRPKLVKNVVSGVGHISGAAVAACLILGWSRPAYSGESTAPAEDQPHLQLAPINLSYSVGGNVGYAFQRIATGAGKSMTQTLGVGVLAGVRISSYFWQPWLAAVSGTVTGGVNQQNTRTNSIPNHYTATTTAFTGDATLNLLKYSRFPFEARIYREDSKNTASYSGVNFGSQITGYSLKQRYESLSNRFSGNANYDSNRTSGPYVSPYDLDMFDFYTRTLLSRYQTLLFSGNTTREDHPVQGRTSVLDTLLADHSYRPNDLFSVATTVNLRKSTYNLAAGITPAQQFDADIAQFSSFASLRPERTPLTLTSSVRFFKMDTSTNGIVAPTQKTSIFNFGANYLFSPLIRLFGSLNVIDTGGTQTIATNAGLVASKAYSAATEIGGFRYSGSIGGGLASTNTTSTDTAKQTLTRNSQSLGLYLTHALNKNEAFGGGQLVKNLNQTISTSFGNSGSSNSRLNSGGYLSWTELAGKETTLLRLSFADSRILSGRSNAFQLVNLQASRSEAITRNESLHGNLTMQVTHSASLPFTMTPTALLGYHHSRAFKVLHLAFDSNIAISDTNIAPTQNPLSPNQSARSWDNNFTYFIGRLKLRLETRLEKISNEVSSKIFFLMDRPF